MKKLLTLIFLLTSYANAANFFIPSSLTRLEENSMGELIYDPSEYIDSQGNRIRGEVNLQKAKEANSEEQFFHTTYGLIPTSSEIKQRINEDGNLVRKGNVTGIMVDGTIIEETNTSVGNIHFKKIRILVIDVINKI